MINFSKIKDSAEIVSTFWHIGRAIAAIIVGFSIIACMNLLDEQYEGLNERATAEVISVESHIIEVEYEFEDDIYQSKTIVKDSSDYAVGDKVKVKFNEDEPGVAVLTGSSQYNTYTVLAKVFMVVGAGFILFGVIRLVPNLKFVISRLKDLTPGEVED